MAQSGSFFTVMTVICYCIISAASAQGCSIPGWFGEGCKYKCHCDPADSCGQDGSCSKCQKGWFGPACQYVDRVGSILPALGETKDGKCSLSENSISILWINSILLTWLRLRCQDDIQDKNDIKIRLKETNYYDGTGKGFFECVNQTSALLDSKTVDIYCDFDMAISQVNISGPQLKSLCAVHISGGRNIALKQKTTQSTTYDPYTSDVAVDGNVNNDIYGGSCTHTDGGKPSWTVTFQDNYMIYQYILYNRVDYQERLEGFTIEAFDSGDKRLFTYTDLLDNALSIYYVRSTSIKPKIKKVTISAKSNILTLCEVEIYGDRECPIGFYGLQCKNPCRCLINGEQCFFSTGLCPSGCSPGYHSDGCQKRCGHGKWGISCLETCDYRCQGGACDAEDGRCVDGCRDGFQGSHCTLVCKPGTYGVNCTSVCPLNCHDKTCDPSTGRCHDCKNGYTGGKCDNECPTGQYGYLCKETCSPNCGGQQLCHPVNGTCLDGCQVGYTGEKCSELCKPGTYGVNCTSVCPLNCHDKTCDPFTGRCHDCKNGYTGGKCDNECPTGRYGYLCKETCSPNCGGQQLCHPVNGTCLDRCQVGYTGDKCSEQCEPDSIALSTKFHSNNTFNGQKYLMSNYVYEDDVKSEAVCQSVCGSLAVVDGKEEGDFVIELIDKYKILCVLIAGNNENPEKKWINKATNQTIKYIEWSRGQPQPNSDANQHCLFYEKGFTKMLDMPCYKVWECNFLCEV